MEIYFYFHQYRECHDKIVSPFLSCFIDFNSCVLLLKIFVRNTHTKKYADDIAQRFE